MAVRSGGQGRVPVREAAASPLVIAPWRARPARGPRRPRPLQVWPPRWIWAPNASVHPRPHARGHRLTICDPAAPSFLPGYQLRPTINRTRPRCAVEVAEERQVSFIDESPALPDPSDRHPVPGEARTVAVSICSRWKRPARGAGPGDREVPCHTSGFDPRPKPSGAGRSAGSGPGPWRSAGGAGLR